MFTLTQLLLMLKEGFSNIHDIMPLVIWLIPGLLSIFSQLYYVIRVEDIAMYLKEWRTLEKAFHIKSCVNKSLHMKLYLTYTIMTLASMAFIGYQVYKSPNNKFFISSIDEILEALSLGPIVAFHVYITFLIWICVSLSECVPGFIYLSASFGVSSLRREFTNLILSQPSIKQEKDIYKNALSPGLEKRASVFVTSETFNGTNEPTLSTRKIEEMFHRFRCISEAVDRANYLFGTPFLVAHGVFLFLICSLVYSILYYLPETFTDQKPDSFVGTHTINAAVLGFRFVAVSWVACELSTSVNELRSSLCFLIGENWSCIGKDERECIVFFLNTVTHSNLAARPRDLYSVTSSFFLSVLGIVLSYVIVLVQSK